MKAEVLYGINDLRFEADYPTPEISNGEILLRVKACGICGSDVARVFTNGTYHFPTIIGHEFAGEVAAVHAESDRSLIGRRFAVFPLKPCMTCASCQAGKYELCEHYDYMGSRCDGGFAEYVAVPKWNLLPIPDEVSFETAAMTEPASVAMHALRRSGMTLGDVIVIFGPGTIGTILAQLACIAGASKVILVGRTQRKLDHARQLCNAITLNSTTCDVVEEVNRLTDGRGADVCIEGTGASSTLSAALLATRREGTIVTMGNPTNDMLLPRDAYWKLLRKQLRLVGTWNSGFGSSDSDWNRIMQLNRSRQLHLSELITHRLRLDQLLDGLTMMADRATYTNKVMIIND